MSIMMADTYKKQNKNKISTSFGFEKARSLQLYQSAWFGS
jgi:hypothetical protein